MTILGIETATEICGAALISDGVVRSEKFLDTPRVHSKQLLPLIDSLFVDGRSRKEIDGIAISIGPGSFTGLRIGLSTAKGLAYALNKPLIAVNTLEALAHRARQDNSARDIDMILPLLESRRDEFFAAAYGIDGGALIEISPAMPAEMDDIVRMIQDRTRVLVTGNGMDKFKRLLAEKASTISEVFLFAGEQFRRCSAASVALLGEQRLARGEVADLAGLEPSYGKEFVAKMSTR
ncbi:MAG TPA: tRNA (adenosine(37)-N6)-threonylcarbamoyltransferase complex dimerization subunit type 1 TsaB [Bacteroidota bacterium]|nr:tRNA (adenosine(37)-N6)-threonylcarbamoyltransferase complex dimerization subunit type 1 TsaB [Bacteroidota bacterium]